MCFYKIEFFRIELQSKSLDCFVKLTLHSISEHVEEEHDSQIKTVLIFSTITLLLVVIMPITVLDLL